MVVVVEQDTVYMMFLNSFVHRRQIIVSCWLQGNCSCQDNLFSVGQTEPCEDVGFTAVVWDTGTKGELDRLLT